MLLHYMVHPDGTAHAGTAILIKKSVQHYEMEKYEKSHLQATSIKVTDKNNTQTTIHIYLKIFGILEFRIFFGFLKTAWQK